MSTELVAILDRWKLNGPSARVNVKLGVLREAADELTALKAKVALLTEALRPFGKLGQYLIDQDFMTKPDHAGLWGFDGIDLTYGDFRQAARALSEPDK